MWISTAPISLIRYLVVWRIQSSLVRIPPCLPAAISTVLGTAIAERLPTQQARPWHKALSAAQQQAEKGRFAPAPWPIEGVVLVPPGKRTYGEDEIVLWELKLLGRHADHGLFLEMLLPAIESVAVTRDPRWFSNYSLWGRFAVQAICVANGAQWEPLAEDGRVNLRIRPNAAQWANGLWKADQPGRPVNRIRWITPFALGHMPGVPDDSQRPHTSDTIARAEIPTLEGIVAALLRRAAHLVHDRSQAVQDVWSLLGSGERDALQALFAAPAALQRHTLVRPPRGWPGSWIGEQSLATPIPIPLLPYLSLAAILHIGDHTHYGCGTFRLK